MKNIILLSISIFILSIFDQDVAAQTAESVNKDDVRGKDGDMATAKDNENKKPDIRKMVSEFYTIKTVKDPVEKSLSPYMGLISIQPTSYTRHNYFNISSSHEGKKVIDDASKSYINTKEGEGKTFYDIQRVEDGKLHDLGIKLKYDDLRIEPKLNVAASRELVVLGDEILFHKYSNYNSFIKRSQILIFRSNEVEEIEVIEFENEAQTAAFKPQITGGYEYALRVYDRKGNFDQTKRKSIEIISKSRSGEVLEFGLKNIYGSNNLLIQNINIDGGTVTVNGKNNDMNNAFIMGQRTPIHDNRFVTAQIIPAGTHKIDIAIENKEGQLTQIQRSIHIADDDWFYVGLGDLTIGKNYVEGPAQMVTNDDEFDENVFINGKFGAYVKGRIKGKYLLTATVNTAEGDINEIFSNLDQKDPRQLLRRIDPDQYYAVYGDDSEITEDAPTQGHFYVKLQKDKNHIMWGNFRTDIKDTEFGKIERALYGANAHYESEGAVGSGEKRFQFDAFAAHPGTLAAREEFRGTGGSLYLMEHQDLSIGSEQVRIEIRDPVTNIVLQSTQLAPFDDYDFNYIQGRLILSQPLASIADDSRLVRSGSLSGNNVFLVVNYEHTPSAFTDFSSFNNGGRVSGWVNDHVKLGITANNENATGQGQKLLAGDLTLQHNTGTYIKAEAANTKGPGSGSQSSIDGGFNFGQIEQGDSSRSAFSYRVETALNLDHVRSDVENSGQISAFYENKEQGFSAPGNLVLYDTVQYGFSANSNITNDLDIRADYNASEESGGTDYNDDSGNGGRDNINSNLSLNYKLNENYYSSIGAEYDKRKNSLEDSTFTNVGERVDAAVKLGYKADSRKWDNYLFTQRTLVNDGNRIDNNRYGVGSKYKKSDKLSLNAEVSEGNGGLGALAGLSYKDGPDTEIYVAYQLDADSTNNGFNSTSALGNEGAFIAGKKKRYSDALSVYGEERFTHDNSQVRDLTHAYGLDYALSKSLKIGGSIQNGITDSGEETALERTATTLTLNYSKKGFSYGSALEVRDEDSATESRTTYLTRNNINLKISDDWRALTKLNHAMSDSSKGEYFDGDFTEASVGFAYRPTMNDKFNSLFKYTYLRDLPGHDQLTATGLTPDYKQRSHILSADFIYDLFKKLSIGAKYGYKKSEITTSRISDEFFQSNAHLVVLRADVHIVKRWDVLIEARYLTVEEAQDERYGALGAVYYHINDNIKGGGGYNFSDFNDDLTNVDYSARGPFINLVSKF
jgi:hypothetical protein